LLSERVQPKTEDAQEKNDGRLIWSSVVGRDLGSTVFEKITTCLRLNLYKILGYVKI